MTSARTARAFLIIVGVLAIVAIFAFRSSPETAAGLVVDVQGDLTSVQSFSLRTGQGDVVRFVPAEDADFDGGPLSHIRDHLRSLEPVVVTYEDREGTLVAIAVADG